MPQAEIDAHRARALNPEHPVSAVRPPILTLISSLAKPPTLVQRGL